MNLAYERAIGIKAVDPIESIACPSCTRPDIASTIRPNTVRPSRLHVNEDATVSQAPAVDDVEHPDIGWMLGTV